MNKNQQKMILTMIFHSCLFVLVSTLFSCHVNKNITYFQEISDSTKIGNLSSANYNDPIIQSDDIMSIVVQTIDPQSSAVVNQVTPSLSIGSSSASAVGSQQITGFLVDKEGNVEIPLLGRIKIAGLTTSQAREVVRTEASKYFKDASVQVRFANFKVTIIGEVARPATYTLPNEKVSVLDALGLAGDLTIYGKRENLLVVRDVDGQKKYGRINLNSTETFKSPFFYLKQNDVIYVEPNKAKIVSTDSSNTRAVTITVSIVTAVLLILYRVL